MTTACYWIVLLLALAPLDISALKQTPFADLNDVSNAQAAIGTLLNWYNEATGLWDTTNWWNSANALTVLADFAALDYSLDYRVQHVYENTFAKAQQTNVRAATFKVMTPYTINSFVWPDDHLGYSKPAAVGSPGFLNDFYDDEGWWALAWLKVYDLTKETRYLQAAVEIFEDMKTGWGATCGGMWWNKQHTYTGAIENELFLTVAAQLANRAVNKKDYLQWALKEWEWFQGTGMINADYNINNGVDFDTCENDGGTIWTYNQGVILGGLVELYKAAPDDSYLMMAERIAIAAIENLSDSNGILHEPCEPDCGADGPQFKGIFMRNLQILQQAVPNDRLAMFINDNADSIWLNDRGDGNQLGLIWSGPFVSADASTQGSACDALVAALAFHLGSRRRPENEQTELCINE